MLRRDENIWQLDVNEKSYVSIQVKASEIFTKLLSLKGICIDVIWQQKYYVLNKPVHKVTFGRPFKFVTGSILVSGTEILSE